VAALTTGGFAMKSSHELDDMRNHQVVSRADLTDQKEHTRRLAITTDVLTGLTLVATAASLWITLKPERRKSPGLKASRTLELGVGPSSLVLHSSF
jgi:hypothetical protein